MASKVEQAVNTVLANIDDVLNQYLSLSAVRSIRLIWGQETPLNELYIYCIPIDLANCLNGIFNSCAVGKAIIRSWGFKRPYLNSEITPPQSKLTYCTTL